MWKSREDEQAYLLDMYKHQSEAYRELRDMWSEYYDELEDIIKDCPRCAERLEALEKEMENRT